MSDTIHKQTVLSMLERDVENKYGHIKQNSVELLSSLSTSFPLINIALPTINKWISSKEKVFLPKVQDLVNVCVEMSFVEPDETVESAYDNSKQLFNKGVDEMIQSHSKFSLESVDQLLQTLIGSTLSL